MTENFYKVLHILGILLLFLSLGGISLFTINGGHKSSNSWRAKVAITHGIATLLVLIGGFGLLTKLYGTNWPLWVYPKILIWLVFGGILSLAYKSKKIAEALWLVLPILGLLATLLVVYKPF